MRYCAGGSGTCRWFGNRADAPTRWDRSVWVVGFRAPQVRAWERSDRRTTGPTEISAAAGPTEISPDPTEISPIC